MFGLSHFEVVWWKRKIAEQIRGAVRYMHVMQIKIIYQNSSEKLVFSWKISRHWDFHAEINTSPALVTVGHPFGGSSIFEMQINCSHLRWWLENWRKVRTKHLNRMKIMLKLETVAVAECYPMGESLEQFSKLIKLSSRPCRLDEKWFRVFSF